MPTELPATPFALFAFVVVILAWITWYLVRGVIETSAKAAEVAAKAAADAAVLLNNHMSHNAEILQQIATHMGRTNQGLDLITNKLLDALSAHTEQLDEYERLLRLKTKSSGASLGSKAPKTRSPSQE